MDAFASGFVCKSSLRDVFYLTDKWIAKLGTPDKEVPNPHYRTAPKMKLWAVSRVEQFIEDHKGDAAFDKMQARRRETIRTAAERNAKRNRVKMEKVKQQRLKLEKWAASCHITVKRLPNRLMEAIRRSQEDFHERTDWRYADECGGPITQRDAVNAVRHTYTNYHYLLDHLTEARIEAGKFADLLGETAYEVIKARVNEVALAELRKHPDFAKLPATRARDRSVVRKLTTTSKARTYEKRLADCE